MELMMWTIPGYETWFRFEGKTISEAEGYKLKAEMVKAGAQIEIVSEANGECKLYIRSKG